MATLKASLKFLTESLLGGMPTSRTEFVLGLNTRSEHRDCRGHSDTVPPTEVRYEYGPRRAFIQHRELGYGFEIDLDAGVYTGWRANAHGSPVWAKPPRREPPRFSGLIVDAHTKTTDTGERRTLFGYAARRVVIEGTSRREGELLSESESDSWYIDPPAAWLRLHPPGRGVAYLASGNVRDEYRFTEEGARETGFAILVTRRSRSYFQDASGKRRSHETLQRDEVTEFSEAVLDPALFLPPREFRWVPQLPEGYRHSLAYRLRLRWEMLKDARALRRALSG